MQISRDVPAVVGVVVERATSEAKQHLDECEGIGLVIVGMLEAGRGAGP